MSEGLNKAILIGNLGRDPELKYTASGKAVLKFRIATTESYRDKEGEKKELTEWHNVTVWGRRAEALNKILHKGKSVAVTGRIRHSDYEGRDGTKKYYTEVVANDIVLLGGPRERAAHAADPHDDAYQPAAVANDDIPF